jgi:hypothetical protein
MQDEVQRYLDEVMFLSQVYAYAEFEAGSIFSKVFTVTPTIDGSIDANEWENATLVDLGRPDMENPFGAALLVKNSETHLYICMDVVGDITNDTGDHASIAFDSGNDNDVSDAQEDQFTVNSSAGSLNHSVYSDAALGWIAHDCHPVEGELTDHLGLAAAAGFGPSVSMAAEHRIYEFSIPLALIGAIPGTVIGFATNGNATYGIYDASVLNGSSWPYFIEPGASLVDYGDLTIAWGPLLTTASLSGTLGQNGWYMSPVNVRLEATGGELGVNWTSYSLDGTNWSYYNAVIQHQTEGVSTMTYYSRDGAGGLETVKSVEIKIDMTPPTTVASVSGRNLSLVAADGVSGVDMTFYRVDSGSWLEYTGTIELSGDESHEVEYYSVDNAGNTEEASTTIVKEGGFGLDFWMVILTMAILVGIAIGATFGMRRKAKESDARSAIKDIGSTYSQMMEEGPPKQETSPKNEAPPKKPGG